MTTQGAILNVLDSLYIIQSKLKLGLILQRKANKRKYMLVIRKIDFAKYFYEKRKKLFDCLNLDVAQSSSANARYRLLV